MFNHELNVVCEEVWHYLEDSVRFGISQGEETLTDNILLYLSRNKSRFSQIQIADINKATKFVESDKGIDWEWLIGSGNCWRHYAVQAKKLHQEKECYAHFRHNIGRANPPNWQHKRLENYADGCGAVPIYAFYNYLRNGPHGNYWHCCQPESVSKLGITVTPLVNIPFDLHPTKYSKFAAVHDYCSTVPMRCLACPKFSQASQKCRLGHSWETVLAKAKCHKKPKSALLEEFENGYMNKDFPYSSKRVLLIMANND